MVLGFRTQWGKPPRPTLFEEKILDNRKKHTLREDLKNRWKAGNSIQFVVGNRTRFRRQFHSGECTGTQTVHITINKKGTNRLRVLVNGSFLKDDTLLLFILNDGFESMTEFMDWFEPLVEAAPNRLLTLKLIHWTDLRY
ncbi:hypothetical protein [Spirosoma oryzicola]|uniref:hypothetical protein n=1 Tax=Spirosoma oryzicola TaxID=2898794 RepID=UPI001E623D70|nr:hypothetical protein [Spirosoma oryzicola]UHG91789.1 hypothetical protein LQ777_02560 [Spirosoma oryzicola]